MSNEPHHPLFQAVNKYQRQAARKEQSLKARKRNLPTALPHDLNDGDDLVVLKEDYGHPTDQT